MRWATFWPIFLTNLSGHPGHEHETELLKSWRANVEKYFNFMVRGSYERFPKVSLWVGR
jgi:hypothetical protein